MSINDWLSEAGITRQLNKPYTGGLSDINAYVTM